jgi:hypothetical protein
MEAKRAMSAFQIQTLAAALLMMLATGCGNNSGEGPEATVLAFMEAVRAGDDDKAAALLTPLAREKTADMDLNVDPPGSDTATFKILAVEVEGDEAQVGSDWTDVDALGNQQTDRVVWMLRRGPEGWRVAGMATRVFDDWPPLILNFEDPADMVKKQRAAEEEFARRDAQASSAAESQPETDETTVR